MNIIFAINNNLCPFCNTTLHQFSDDDDDSNPYFLTSMCKNNKCQINYTVGSANTYIAKLNKYVHARINTNNLTIEYFISNNNLIDKDTLNNTTDSQNVISKLNQINDNLIFV